MRSWSAGSRASSRRVSFREEIGQRHGLKAHSGLLLGGKAPGVADVVTAPLWSTMADRFPKIEAILKDAAPMTATLVERVAKVDREGGREAFPSQDVACIPMYKHVDAASPLFAR